MPRDWSPAARAKQRDLINKAKPWLRSSGPRTKRGKAVSSQNGKKPATLEMFWNCPDEAEARRIWQRLWYGKRIKPSQ